MARPTTPEIEPPDAPPETWMPMHRMAKGLIAPIERFLHVQAASAILLVVATVIALAWANSPWGESYDHLWHAPIRIGVASYTFEQSLHFWINDGLMVIFFFVVGLEIRREIHEGELSDLKRASLPIAAALGGMIAPALIYIALNPVAPQSSGWGVPMATDIAFAVGVLTLVGKGVPAALRVLLLALAIIDDIGAILVIAIFYSSGISLLGIGIAVAGMGGVLLLKWIGIRRPFGYIAPGIVLWAGMLIAGIHPTIAGVILGLMTPVRAWYGLSGFLHNANAAIQEFKEQAKGKSDDHSLMAPLDRLEEARREAVAPVIRLQQHLHGYSAYFIMPVFALANAGVNLQGISFDAPGSMSVFLGIVLGLVVGKILGVFAISFLAVKTGLSSLPRGVDWKGIVVVGGVAGIGFTMSIFIAGLAFDSAQLLGVAKLGILVASVTAAAVAMVFGKVFMSKPLPAGIARTASEAESSTDM